MKYRPQTEILSTMLNHLISGGIPEHELKKYDWYRGKKHVRKYLLFNLFIIARRIFLIQVTSLDEDSMKLKASHVMVVSFVLIAVQVCALVTFVIELTCERKMRRNNVSKMMGKKKKTNYNNWNIFGARSRKTVVMGGDEEDLDDDAQNVLGENYF